MGLYNMWCHCLDKCPPKAHRLMALWGNRANLRRCSLVEGSRALKGCPWREYQDPSSPHSLLPGFLGELPSSTIYSLHAVGCCHRPRTTGWCEHRLNPLKLWAEYTDMYTHTHTCMRAHTYTEDWTQGLNWPIFPPVFVFYLRKGLYKLSRLTRL